MQAQAHFMECFSIFGASKSIKSPYLFINEIDNMFWYLTLFWYDILRLFIVWHATCGLCVPLYHVASPLLLSTFQRRKEMTFSSSSSTFFHRFLWRRNFIYLFTTFFFKLKSTPLTKISCDKQRQVTFAAMHAEMKE